MTKLTRNQMSELLRVIRELEQDQISKALAASDLRRMLGQFSKRSYR